MTSSVDPLPLGRAPRTRGCASAATSRINAAGGATTADRAQSQAAGDPNFGAHPRIVDAACINSTLGAAPASTACAAFRVGNVTRLYNINLATGAASLIGAIGNGADFHDGQG